MNKVHAPCICMEVSTINFDSAVSTLIYSGSRKWLVGQSNLAYSEVQIIVCSSKVIKCRVRWLACYNNKKDGTIMIWCMNTSRK